MSDEFIIAPSDLAAAVAANAVLFDCRFDLMNPGAGRAAYHAAHVPGAHYLDLDTDLSVPGGKHGGRHPLPSPQAFAQTMARYGVDLDTDVIAYDDSRFAFAGRLWWMLRALGYRPPRLLDGGYSAWLAAGGEPTSSVPEASPVPVAAVSAYAGCLDIEGLRAAQEAGATLVDSRDGPRYRGEVEPIDPVAGHIPGAQNRPWMQVTTEEGRLRSAEELTVHWGPLLQAEPLVVYCGSGVSACCNLFSLARLGREDAQLYAGSWSDWCSYL